MRKRRKSDNCPNCAAPLGEEHNYCAVCGQENTRYRLSVGQLLVDFSQNYFNFDSRLGRSLGPFLLRPGFLTEQYVKGRRVAYVHPLRFYFIVSLIFFFLFGLVSDKEELSVIDYNKGGTPTLLEIQKTKSDLEKQLYLSAIGGKVDSLAAIEKLERVKDLGNLDDLLKETKSTISIERAIKEVEDVDEQDKNTNFFGDSYKVDYGKLFLVWTKDADMTPDALLDSLHASEKNAFNRRIAKQLIRLGGKSQELLMREVIENIPIMVFLLLPIFAFILKLLYIRSRKLYIEHAVFTLHFHTFSFFIHALALLLYLVWDDITVFILAFLLTGIYLFIMMLNFYRQHWLKTGIKIFVLYNVYGVVIMLFLVFEIMYSVLFF